MKTLSLTITALALALAGCGGGGGGGTPNPFAGNWTGAWSDASATDQGLYTTRVTNSGSVSGTAEGNLCGNRGAVSGSVSTTATVFNVSFAESGSCYKYTVKATGDPFTRYQSGWATIVNAKFYDRFGAYIGTAEYGLYQERDNRSGELSTRFVPLDGASPIKAFRKPSGDVKPTDASEAGQR